MSFRLDKLTIKAQEAVQRRRTWPRSTAILKSIRSTSWWPCCRKRMALSLPILQKIGVQRRPADRDAGVRAEPLSEGQWRYSARMWARICRRSCGPPSSEAETMKDEFVSTEHLLLALTKVNCQAQSLLQLNGVRQR